jgi:hypothetical protein
MIEELIKITISLLILGIGLELITLALLPILRKTNQKIYKA